MASRADIRFPRGPRVRLLSPLLVLALAATLLAATPPPTTAVPMTVVFPFQTSAELKPDTGVKAAQLFAQQMNQAGGIDAIDGPTNISRSGYLAYARNLQADYYVTGYMTPLGGGVSLVEQVVSTQSGTIVYGATAQINSFDDASAQAVQIHDALLAIEAENSDRYASAQAESTSTPLPTGNQANIGKGLSDLAGLFKHHGAATPKPAAIVKPSKGVLLLPPGGALSSAQAKRANSDLYYDLLAYYHVHPLGSRPRNIAAASDGICGTNRDNVIADPTFASTSSRRLLGSQTQWTVTLDFYACFGAKLAQSTGSADSLDDAVKSAVASYAKAHPRNE